MPRDALEEEPQGLPLLPSARGGNWWDPSMTGTVRAEVQLGIGPWNRLMWVGQGIVNQRCRLHLDQVGLQIPFWIEAMFKLMIKFNVMSRFKLRLQDSLRNPRQAKHNQ